MLTPELRTALMSVAKSAIQSILEPKRPTAYISTVISELHKREWQTICARYENVEFKMVSQQALTTILLHEVRHSQTLGTQQKVQLQELIENGSHKVVGCALNALNEIVEINAKYYSNSR